MGIEFTFNHNKAIEAILYIANRVEKADIHRIFKLLYLADKAHLAQESRFILGDSYAAMKHGPAPIKTYTILRAVRGDGTSYYANKAWMRFRIDGDCVRPLTEANTNFFSPSDLACLDAVIVEHGHKSASELAAASHDSAWDSVGCDDFITVEALVQTFANGTELLIQAPYDTGAPSIPPDDPIWLIGANPIVDLEITDGSINHDKYIYGL